jgi:hypothetical protein
VVGTAAVEGVVVAGTVDVVEAAPPDVGGVVTAGWPLVGKVLVVVGDPGTVVVGDVVDPPGVVVVVVEFATVVDVDGGAGAGSSA